MSATLSGSAKRNLPSSVVVTISPRDPLIFRDGRPFGMGEGAGNRARSLDWPYPQTVAGAIRTLMGRLEGGGSSRSTVNPFHDLAFLERLRSTGVVGPFPLTDEGLYVPAPLDAVAYEGTGQSGASWNALRPQPLAEGEGCDMPHPSLWPVRVERNEKTQEMPSFWSMASVAQWLGPHTSNGFRPSGTAGFPKEERVHIGRDSTTATADESKLFTTEGVVIPDFDRCSPSRPFRTTAMATLVDPADEEMAKALSSVRQLQSFGGERRVAYFRSSSDLRMWQCSDAIRKALAGARLVRMMLVTPAIFRKGWLPGWLDSDNLEGAPPGTQDGLRLRLRGACVGRWRPVSGWSLEKGSRGPKAIRRVVPAGGVYFFERVSGEAADLADLWFRAVSDDAQDRLDGYGGALWGLWNHERPEGGLS